MSRLCTGSFLVLGRTDGGGRVLEADTIDSVDMCYLILSWRRWIFGNVQCCGAEFDQRWAAVSGWPKLTAASWSHRTSNCTFSNALDDMAGWSKTASMRPSPEISLLIIWQPRYLAQWRSHQQRYIESARTRSATSKARTAAGRKGKPSLATHGTVSCGPFCSCASAQPLIMVLVASQHPDDETEVKVFHWTMGKPCDRSCQLQSGEHALSVP